VEIRSLVRSGHAKEIVNFHRHRANGLSNLGSLGQDLLMGAPEEALRTWWAVSSALRR